MSSWRVSAISKKRHLPVASDVGLGLLTSLLAVSRRDTVKGQAWELMMVEAVLLQGRSVLEGQPSCADTRSPCGDSWPPVEWSSVWVGQVIWPVMFTL